MKNLLYLLFVFSITSTALANSLIMTPEITEPIPRVQKIEECSLYRITDNGAMVGDIKAYVSKAGFQATYLLFYNSKSEQGFTLAFSNWGFSTFGNIENFALHVPFILTQINPDYIINDTLLPSKKYTFSTNKSPKYNDAQERRKRDINTFFFANCKSIDANYYRKISKSATSLRDNDMLPF